jgi:hypothetical protein
VADEVGRVREHERAGVDRGPARHVALLRHSSLPTSARSGTHPCALRR